MKLIIDIPKGEYDKICKTMMHTSSGNPNFYFESKIANGTPIPDNATNGEVLKTIFKPNRITRMDDIVREEYDFTHEWWNSPYQKGGK